jgi:pyruvate,water dikinase
MHTSSDWLLPLDDNRCSDPELVGGKASQLHALIKDDFPVPQAWVLTQAAFDGHFPDASAVETPDRPMLQMLVQASLREVAEELLTGATSYLAVRSSALAEDGVDHSYAGQHATYYYVTADSLGKAVIDCWLSLWSDAASAYRAQVPYQTLFGMPIIIQQMVPAERSGVCFTRDPTGRHPQQMLIEASWGLGAALVDGRVSPDRYRLDADLNLTDQQIGQKRLKVVADLSNPDGSRLEGVPVHQQTKPVLSPAQATRIAELAARAERLNDGPQDMEWAMVGEEVHVLQSRPITALPSPSTPADITGRWVLFKPIVENISQPLTPLTVDLFRRVLPPIGQFIQGRYYLNADLLKLLIPADLDDSVLQDLLMLRPVDPKPPLNWRRLPKTLGLLIGSYLSFGISWHRTARVPLERLSDFTERCESVVADETQNPLTILSALFLNRNPLAPISQLAFQVNISAGRYFLLTDLLTRLLNKWAPDFDQRNHLALLTSGGEAMISQQMVEAVKDLAKLASDDPETRALLLDDPIPDTGSVLHNLDPDQPFARAFTGFLERFGHRAIGEIELMTPRWREDASAVVQMVRNLLKQEGLPAAVDPHGLRLAAQDTLHQALPELWQRKLIDWLLTRIRYYVTARENTRYFHTMTFAAVRARIKQWELALLENQRLRCIDDVFFLEWPELSALEAGALDWQDVEARILERRRLYHRLCDSEPQESFNLGMQPLADLAGELCHGDCASPGVAEGRARVILNPGTSVSIEPGEILVAPYTDPAWTPLFPAAAAVVVEVGSFLSHAGTVAREYQIPCLVDVRNCTRIIQTGQLIRVNANEGWVEIVESP